MKKISRINSFDVMARFNMKVSFSTHLLKMPLLVVLLVWWSSVAYAENYYLAPSGSDAYPGNSASLPWKTFDHALSLLKPGDSLILTDGTYLVSNSGHPRINCKSNAKNGTASAPITIKADHERKAFIKGDGTKTLLKMDNCSFWNIEGLRFQSGDKDVNINNERFIWISNSHNIVLRRLLASHNNRFRNEALILLSRTGDSLLEENEFYYFDRHAITTKDADNNVFRRNYCNSRLWPNVSGGRPSHIVTRGDACISIYPGSNIIIENTISENNEYLVEVMATDKTENNRILGSISLNDIYGSVVRARGKTANEMPVNTIYENFVSIGAKYHGLYARTTKATRCNSCSMIKNNGHGIVADLSPTSGSWSGDGISTFYSDNSLSWNNKLYGFNMVSQNDFLIQYFNSYQNSKSYSPNSTNYLDGKTLNPEMGACKVFLPEGSPLKGAGKDGKDIGANILYRYENGTLTNKPLWDPVTGEFPGGAIIPGINDMPNESRFDVHKRLNVNHNGCSLPSGYAQSGGPDNSLPMPPTNLQFMQLGQ